MQCLGFNHIKQCVYRLQPKKYPLSHPPSLEPVFVCPFWATVETYFVTRSLYRHKRLILVKLKQSYYFQVIIH